MSTLGDNLKLGFEAAKYAKTAAPRSANQTYYKKWRPRTNQKRNIFLLGYMRGGSMLFQNEDGQREQWFIDPDVERNRKAVGKMLKETADPDEREEKLDEFIKKLGATYFFQASTPGFQWDKSGSELEKMSAATYRQVVHPDALTDEDFRKIGKRLNLDGGLIKQASGDRDSQLWQTIMKEYSFQDSVHQASKVGIGNCGEKADLAAYYLLDRTPGGKRITIYCLDNEHKLFGHPGDHAFAVIGHTASAGDVGSLGADAVIVDGWMNDVYPAQHYLQWKYGYNYDNSRINLKQLNIRALICKFYRTHIMVSREFGARNAGPQSIPVPTINPSKSAVQ